MAYPRNYRCVLDGTNEERCLLASTGHPLLSVTISERTAAIAVTARFIIDGPASTMDSFTIPAGKALTVEFPGTPLNVVAVVLDADSACDVDLLVMYP